MNIDLLLHNENEWYKGWKRALIHVLLWIMVFLFDAVRTSFIIKEIDVLFFVYTLRQLLTIIFCYYFFVYYAIPRLLIKARWFYFTVCIFLAYIFMFSGIYFTLYIIRIKDMVPDQLTFLANVYLKYDFFRALIDPVIIYNTVLFHSSLFFIMLIKITKDLFISILQKHKLEKERIFLKNENIKHELNFLRAQINPHFFFNTLNNIYSIIIDKDEFAADLVLKLSDLMRYSLYESGNEKISLKEELKFISDYIDLEKIRHKEHVKIDVHIEGNPNSYVIPPLILVTFVENAFKHGVNNTIDSSWVNIFIQIQDSGLTFTAQNSKPSKIKNEKIQGGIGIANLRRRLNIIYPDRYYLKIEDHPLEYTVELKLQLNEKEAYMLDSGRRTTRSESFGEVY